MSKVHIGKKIKEVLDKGPLTVVGFAKKINLTRNGAYKVFKKETIDTGQLQKIGKVLNYDFFTYYMNHEQPAVEDNKGGYGGATKEELQQMTNTILKEIEKLREELSVTPKTSPVKKSVKKKNS